MIERPSGNLASASGVTNESDPLIVVMPRNLTPRRVSVGPMILNTRSTGM